MATSNAIKCPILALPMPSRNSESPPEWVPTARFKTAKRRCTDCQQEPLPTQSSTLSGKSTLFPFLDLQRPSDTSQTFNPHLFSPESLKTSWSNPVQHFAFRKTFKTCWSNPGQQVLFRQIKKSRYSSFLRRRPGRGALGPHFPAPTGLNGPGPLIPVQWQLSVLTLTTQGPSSSSPCPHFKHLP